MKASSDFVKVADEAGKLRRIPSQERSRKRLEAILEAAAAVFAEAGFEAATIEAIAERAETSVGSLYQFFPNKRAIFKAVAERCMTNAGEVFSALLGEAPAERDWRELLDTVIDGFADLHARDAYFRAVWSNIQMYQEYAEADAALERALVEVTSGLIGVWAPSMEPARRRVVATVLVDTVGAMLLIAYRDGPKKRAELLDETKRMLRRYLEPEVTSR